MDNAFIQEKLLPQLNFNPGLALTGFRTTRPWSVNFNFNNSLPKLFFPEGMGCVHKTCGNSAGVGGLFLALRTVLVIANVTFCMT